MKMGRCKQKRGDGGSIEHEVNSAKKPNKEATDCTSNDSEAEELEVYFHETVSEQEPSPKDMLSSVQATLMDIYVKSRKMAEEMVLLKVFFWNSSKSTKFYKTVSE